MPRVAGELAYGTGVAAGLGKRGIDAVAGSPKTKALAELYNKYPQLFLVPSQVGTKLQETEQERLERLYADSVPSVPANVIPEDYVPEAQTTFVAPEAAPVAEAAPAPVDKETTFTVGNITAKFDPVNNDFYDVKDPSRRVKELADFANLSLNMYRGGTVQAFKNGGRAGYDYANAARTFGQGLTFGFGDEIEAKLRALASKDPNAYANEVKRIRLAQEHYAAANPMTAGGLEMAGMVGGAMLTPSMAALRVPGALGRVVARAPRLSRIAAEGVEDALQGAAYSAGKATEGNRMQAIRRDAPGNALVFAELTGAGYGLKKAASTKPGRRVVAAATKVAQKPLAVIRRR
jgi:hypothetical protein